MVEQQPPQRPRRSGARAQRVTRWGENVVMADFGSRRRAEGKSEPSHGGDNQRDSARGVRQRLLEGESWAAAVLMEAIARATDSGRLARGREYYRAGRVMSVELDINLAVALVTGTQLEPFHVTFRLIPLGQRGVDSLNHAFLKDTSHVRSLLAGSAPGENLADQLFSPEHVGQVACNCPDKSRVCKHVVAAAYAVAERLTGDPMRIVRWRGLDPDAILQPLRDYNGSDVIPLATGLLGRVNDRDNRGGSSTVTPESDSPAPMASLSLSDADEDLVDSAEFWGDPGARVKWGHIDAESGLDKGRRQDLVTALRGVSWSTVDQVKTLHELELCYEALMEADPLFEQVSTAGHAMSTDDASNENDGLENYTPSTHEQATHDNSEEDEQ